MVGANTALKIGYDFFRPMVGPFGGLIPPPKKPKGMKEKGINELIEQTFERLSCPFRSLGFYTEIYQALLKAFELGQGSRENPYALPWENQIRIGTQKFSLPYNPMHRIPLSPYKESADPVAEEQNVWAAWVDEISDGEPHI